MRDLTHLLRGQPGRFNGQCLAVIKENASSHKCSF